MATTKAARRAPATEYTPELADEFCGYLAEGLTVRQACGKPGMPDKRSIFRWLGKNPDFAALYRAAQAIKAEAFADEMVTIADSNEDPAKVRNMVSTRQWLSARMSPRVFGDKLDLNHGGEVAVKVEIRRFTPAPGEV